MRWSGLGAAIIYSLEFSKYSFFLCNFLPFELQEIYGRNFIQKIISMIVILSNFILLHLWGHISSILEFQIKKP